MGAQLSLAAEDAPGLAGQGGHAEPAEGSGEARGLLLPEGPGTPLSPHLDSEAEEEWSAKRGSGNRLDFFLKTGPSRGKEIGGQFYVVEERRERGSSRFKQ